MVLGAKVKYITSRFKQALPDKIPSSVIYEEIKKYGYDGKIRILQTFLSSLKTTTTAEEVIRFETKPSYQAQVDWTFIRTGKNPIYGFNNDFLEFAKDNFIPKLCKVYRAQTKGKVERFNLYLKRNFYIPLKATLKGSQVEINCDLLNNKVFAWLEMANCRIHDTTKKKPIDMFKEEKHILQPFYSSVKEVKNKIEDKTINSSVDLEKLNIDIKYYTTISDYEKVLGSSYATA